MLDEKELKQQILDSVNDDQIPNFATAIKAKHEAQKPKKPWYKKGGFIGLTSALLACGVVAAVVIPNLNNDSSSIQPSKPVNVPIVGKKNEIAFGVLSVSNLLPESGINAPLAFQKQKIDETIFAQEMNRLNPYMSTAEAMLNNNMDIAPIMIESDDPNYPYLMQITSFGETLNFYYKDENLAPKKAYYLDDDDDESEEEDDESEDESEEENDDEEQEYSYVGLLKKENESYKVDLKKELEQGEYELELKIYLDDADLSTYIAIEQEIESEEQSYEYIFVDKGKETLGAEISFETEDNETVVEIELFQDNIESTYSIKGKNSNFTAEYEIKDYESGHISINVSGDSYIYKEEQLNFTITLKR